MVTIKVNIIIMISYAILCCFCSKEAKCKSILLAPMINEGYIPQIMMVYSSNSTAVL